MAADTIMAADTMKKQNANKTEIVATRAKAILQEFKNKLRAIHREALALVRTHEQRKIAAVKENIKNIIN